MNEVKKAPTHLDGTPWHKCSSYEELEEYFGMVALDNDPKHPKWWLVGRFTDGDLWMNNEDGFCYLDSSESLDVYYAFSF